MEVSKSENTLIQVILDKSGSMAGQVGDTLKGINHFIAEHRTNVPNARFSLTTFDTHFNLVLADVPMSEVKDLTLKDYTPGGGTALLSFRAEAGGPGTLDRPVHVYTNLPIGAFNAPPRDRRCERSPATVLTSGGSSISSPGVPSCSRSAAKNSTFTFTLISPI